MTIAPTQEIAAALPGYEIGGELGRGAMGVVLAARHMQLGREVAIKRLPPGLAADPAVRSRFAAEARVLAALEHPHIVPVYDFVDRDGLCLLVMEHLAGGTVWDRFVVHGFSHEAACGVAVVTCAALHYAHQSGVLHRDIKPENLLYGASGQLKVTDFGIAKVIGGDDTLATRAGSIIGSPAYIAPEQAGGGELGPPADVYSAGITLYELLSGSLPYSEEGGSLALVYRHVHEDAVPIRSIAPEVDPGVADVIMRALARDPRDRYPTAEAFGLAIAAAATAAWGRGWLERSGTRMLAAGPLAAATAGPPPIEAAAFGPPPRQRFAETEGYDAPPAFDEPAGPSAALLPGLPVVAPALAFQPAPPAPAPQAVPAVPRALVYPRAPERVSGADFADISGDLIPVREVLLIPRPPVTQWLAVAVLLVVVLLPASLGVGRPHRHPLAGARIVVNGADVSQGGTARIDPRLPIVVDVRSLPSSAAGTRVVTLRLSVAGVPIETTPDGLLVERPDGSRRAVLDASRGRFLLAGSMTAELTLSAVPHGVGSVHQFLAIRSRRSMATVPAGLLAILLLMVLSYAESALRPLRRTSVGRFGGFVRLAIVGTAFGAVVACFGWLLGWSYLTPRALIACAVPGALLGVAVASATVRSARRRLLRQVTDEAARPPMLGARV